MDSKAETGKAPALAAGKREARGKVRRKSIVREYGEAIVVAVALTLVIRTFIIQAFRIPTGSMEDTLLVGDHLFVNKFVYGAKIPFTDWRLPRLRDPARGDIVVFKFPEDPSRDFIKRMVALPGDTVQIRDKVLYRNGEPVGEDYIKVSSYSREPGAQEANIFPAGAGNRDNYGLSRPVVVPDGHYFMMGDNRDHSDDSRFWGFLPRENIKGKAMFIYFSIDNTRPWYKRLRLTRFLDVIH